VVVVTALLLAAGTGAGQIQRDVRPARVRQLASSQVRGQETLGRQPDLSFLSSAQIRLSEDTRRAALVSRVFVIPRLGPHGG
jgi:hypothetical protein